MSLLDLLGGLLRKAFANYDLESLITAFLIVRQAALEGPALFPPYTEWFKVRGFPSWGGGSWACRLWRRQAEEGCPRGAKLQPRDPAFFQASRGLGPRTPGGRWTERPGATYPALQGCLVHGAAEGPRQLRRTSGAGREGGVLASWAPGTALCFQLTFGNGSSLHGSSKKALIFFFKFLSQLVPFEAPQYLKVGVPFAPRWVGFEIS